MGVDSKKAEQPDDLVAQAGEFRAMLERLVAGSSAQIGEIALLALTGEPFVEGQLRIKLGSPAPYTFVAHMSNGYVGYIPTSEAIKRGGYETDTSHWSKLAPQALDMIVEESVAVLDELYS